MTESDSKIYWLRLYRNKCIFKFCSVLTSPNKDETGLSTLAC